MLKLVQQLLKLCGLGSALGQTALAWHLDVRLLIVEAKKSSAEDELVDELQVESESDCGQ